MFFNKDKGAQGAIEYLLIIGAVILVVAVVIIALSGVFSGAKENLDANAASTGTNQLKDDFNKAMTDRVVDTAPPSIMLTSPSSGEGTPLRDVNFVFDVTDSSKISSCTVYDGEGVTVCNDINNGLNKVSHSFMNDGVFDWNVSCVDIKGNIGFSGSNTIRIDSAAPLVSFSEPFNNSVAFGDTVRFVFDISDATDVNCTLNIDGDKRVYGSLIDGTNGVEYSISGSKRWVDWNIICSDGINSVSSDQRELFLDTDPYQIYSCIELQAMENDLEGEYALMKDIDCGDDTQEGGVLYNDGLGFSPIGSCGSNNNCVSGNYDKAFRGTFDGKNYSIKNLKINRPSESYTGLFRFVYLGAEIRNVSLEDNNIIGRSGVGALVGDNNGALVINSNANGIVYGSGSSVGGLAGVNYGTIESSYTSGKVSADSSIVGGLVGVNYGVIQKNYSSALTDGNTPIPTTYKDVTGGLIGSNYGLVQNNYTVGTTRGNNYVGGLVGRNDAKGKVYNNYSAESVNGKIYVGGLIGRSDGTVMNNYSTGPINALADTGGLIGYMGGASSIANYNFSVSSVSAKAYASGVIGTKLGGDANYNYWDIGLTGKTGCWANLSGVESTVGCNSTNNNPIWYYYPSNAPLSSWTWGDDGNWKQGFTDPSELTYPMLSWQ